MKKLVTVLLVSFLGFSCGNKSTKTTETKSDTLKPAATPVVGNDEDEHGCKPSTGYTWSEVKQECVKLFEAGTKLYHSEDDGKSHTSVSYVIFEGNKAELFLDTQKGSMILERKSEGEPWVFEDYELIPWKGYVLKKEGQIIYTGQ